MAQQFLHGVETINISNGPRPVQEVKTAVIGIVGIAPKGRANTLVLVKNDVDAAEFGKELPGFDIPQALNIIFGYNAGTVIVVNVFDEARHTSNVVDELQTIVNGKLKLGFAPIGVVTIKEQDGTDAPYVLGTDYTLDEFGNFAVIAGKIANATILKFSYKKLNAAAVTSADIIGAVNADGTRTGLKALDLSFSSFGFRPKILLVPGRSAIPAIASEMLVSADKFRAVALIDSTLGDNVQTAITERGDATKAFGTSNKRSILCYPYLKSYDVSKDDGNPDTDTNSNFPFSINFAGLMAWTDKNSGYWDSPSNYNLDRKSVV